MAAYTLLPMLTDSQLSAGREPLYHLASVGIEAPVVSTVGDDQFPFMFSAPLFHLGLIRFPW